MVKIQTIPVSKKFCIRWPFRLIVCLISVSFVAGMTNNSASSQGTVGLYGTWERQITNNGNYNNPFNFNEIELQATFTSPTGKKSDFFGFYDGDGNGGQTGNVWKLRFMPNEIGTWTYTYSWSDGKSGGSGSFQVVTNTNPSNHGHVQVDPNFPRYLIHDDGTPHYWWGGNWIDSDSYHPGGVSDKQFAEYLDILQHYEHNGLLIKTALYPLRDDKYTWDIAWINRAEWLVKEMLNRGIYAQVNFFDTWSRERGSLDFNTNGDQQVFNAWKSGDEGAKENYIKTIVARFASYPNVYWELGNEMEHAPNSGSGFVSEANSKYIPWIRQNDPYDLPIGLSEGVWQDANVDIGFLHQTTQLPAESWDQPTIMNELVNGGITGSLWDDATIRNSTNRIAYRRAFWRMFVFGGTGSSEATWLEFTNTPNQAVLNVMQDHQGLRRFIESFPISINEMDTDDSFVISGQGEYRTRSKDGVFYVTYFLLDPGQSRSAGTVRVGLPAGSYDVNWCNPKDGSSIDPTSITSGGETITLAHPAFVEDIVLRISQTSTLNGDLTSPASGSNSIINGDDLQQNALEPAIKSASSFVFLPLIVTPKVPCWDLGLGNNTSYTYEVPISGLGGLTTTLESARQFPDSIISFTVPMWGWLSGVFAIPILMLISNWFWLRKFN